jgi:hypothetical protein
MVGLYPPRCSDPVVQSKITSVSKTRGQNSTCAYIMQEVVQTSQRNLSSDNLRHGVEGHVQLVTEQVKDGHRAEDFGSTELLLHDDSLQRKLASSPVI